MIFISICSLLISKYREEGSKGLERVGRRLLKEREGIHLFFFNHIVIIMMIIKIPSEDELERRVVVCNHSKIIAIISRSLQDHCNHSKIMVSMTTVANSHKFLQLCVVHLRSIDRPMDGQRLLLIV